MTTDAVMAHKTEKSRKTPQFHITLFDIGYLVHTNYEKQT